MSTIKCKSIGCNAHIPRNEGLDFCPDCVADRASNDPQTEQTSSTSWSQLRLDIDHDPTGLDQHQTGAKVDAGKVRMHLITGGMARAITEVAKIATFGAAKYTDNGWISVPDGFRRYEDAQQRHAAKRHMGEVLDPDSGRLHLAHEAWNCLAKLDLYLRENPT